MKHALETAIEVGAFAKQIDSIRPSANSKFPPHTGQQADDTYDGRHPDGRRLWYDANASERSNNVDVIAAAETLRSDANLLGREPQHGV